MEDIRIEGAEARTLPREPHDRGRPAGPGGARAVCHAPFVSIHVDGRGRVTPCRYSTAVLGRVPEETLAEVWSGAAVGALRSRFRAYRVGAEACGACVTLWEDGLHAHSPARAEFDAVEDPGHEAPEAPRWLAVDAEAPLGEAQRAELLAWLPGARRLEIVLRSAAGEAACSSWLEAVLQLPPEGRPRVRVHAEGFVPKPGRAWAGAGALTIGLQMETPRPTPEVQRALAALGVEARELGLPVAVRVEVHAGNWIHLEPWQAQLTACAIGLLPALAAPGHETSLARLGGHELSALRGVLGRWLRDRPEPEIRLLLERLRAWQAQAGAAPATARFVLPALGHPLLQDEQEAELLLGDLLRIYASDAVEAWLTQLVRTEGFAAEARARRSLRLAALWLACVFRRPREGKGLGRAGVAEDVLRRAYETREAARRISRADLEGLRGSRWEPWLQGWARELRLLAPLRRRRPFPARPVLRSPKAEPARVTVIVPSHDHESFIGAALASVLSQTRGDFRLLVVDDASTDATVERARDFDDARLAVQRNARNLGLGPTLHRALRDVRTPYVAVLNSDDVYASERLARCLQALERDPRAQLVATGVVPIDAEARECSAANASPLFDGRRMADWLHWHASRKRPPARASELFAALLERNFLLTSSNLVARRSFLLRHAALWKSLEYCVDWQLFLLAALERKLVHLPEPLLGYRLHASNTVFDAGRRWRLYLEANQVAARTLERMFAAGKRRRAPGALPDLVAAVAGPLEANRSVDASGILLALYLERAGRTAREAAFDALAEHLRSLDESRRSGHQAVEVLRSLGGDASALHRLRGERPFLETARVAGEVLSDRVAGLREELQQAHRELGAQRELRTSAESEAEREALQRQALAAEFEALRRAQAQESELARARHEALQRAEEEARRAREELAARYEQERALEEAQRSELEAAREAQRRSEEEARLRAEQEARARAEEEARLRAEQEARARAEEEARAHAERALAQERASEERLRQLTEASQARVQELDDRLRQRGAELRALERSVEYRTGDLLLNRTRLRGPLSLAERTRAGALHRLTLAGLARERRRHVRRGQGWRAMATICWNFPIYSQTFVHQELSDLVRRGFDLRVVYSLLEPREHLHGQFDGLWERKRRLILNSGVQRADLAYFRRRLPRKVDELTALLVEASGRPEAYVVDHANYLQAFSYARMVEAYRPDYLHSYFFYDRSLFALVAAWLLDVPRGVSCYADHALADYEFKLVPLHLRLCDLVVATSARIKRELLELARDVDADKILVKPNGVDCGVFEPLERAEPGPGEPFRIVCVGRIEPKKGMLDLLEATALLRRRGLHVEVHIVGEADEADYRERFVQRIEELELWGTVHLEGRSSLAEVRRFLGMAQLFVAPFVETEAGDKDGIPTALLEALATGLPAVATDAGSISEVVEPGAEGLLVPQHDAEALADALEALLKDPARRARMATRAVEKVHGRFDARSQEGRFHERVLALLEARRRR